MTIPELIDLGVIFRGMVDVEMSELVMRKETWVSLQSRRSQSNRMQRIM